MQGLVKRDKLNFAPMSEALIRSIIFKSLLFEGFKDDQRYLIEKYPQEQSKLSQLQPKWIGWLISRFGENPKFAETHPFEDALVTIQNFAKKDVAVGDKSKSNEQFKTEISHSLNLIVLEKLVPGTSGCRQQKNGAAKLHSMTRLLERLRQHGALLEWQDQTFSTTTLVNQDAR